MPTTQLAHQQPEIERADVNQEPFEDVVVPAQVHSPHPPGFVEMRTRVLQLFTALPQEALATRATNAPAVAIDCIPRVRIVLPIAPAAIGLRDVAPHADAFEFDEFLIPVISLVADDFFEPVCDTVVRAIDRVDP